MKPTKQQWDEVKRVLSGRYGAAYLRCDGYLVCAAVEQDKMKLVIMVYVNGYFRGKDVWTGKERDLDKMGDIARRFYCLGSKGPSAKKIALNKKVFGAKWCKENGINDRHYYSWPMFRTPGAFIAHIKKHNEQIEILSSDEHSAAIAQLKETAGNAVE